MLTNPWQPDRWELQRLILHIERGLVTQTHLRTLLIAAGNTVADHRRALRDIRGRIKRRVSKARDCATSRPIVHSHRHPRGIEKPHRHDAIN